MAGLNLGFVAVGGGVMAGRMPPAALVVGGALPLALRAWWVARGYCDGENDLSPADLLTIRVHNLVGVGLIGAYPASAWCTGQGAWPGVAMAGVLAVLYLPAARVVFGGRPTAC